MKILFIVTGIGYGDAIREHAIIQAFMKHDKKTKVLIAGYDNSYAYFKNKYPIVKIYGYKFVGRRMNLSFFSLILLNYILPLFWWFNLFKLGRVCSKFKPDLIISDFEPVGVFLSKRIRKKCIFIFGYDPVVFRKFPYKNSRLRIQAKYLEKLYNNKYADKVIIPKLLGGRSKKGKYYYTNPIVRELPEESEKELLRELGLEKKPIVVMLGGSEFGELISYKIKRLAKRLDEKFIIFGGKRKVKGRNIEHFLFDKRALKYIKVSKGIITLAGQKTITEGIVLKKPMLIFPINNHVEQLLNAYELRKLAMVKYNTKDFKKGVLNFIRKLPKLQERMNKFRVDASGAEEVAKIVLGKR